MPQTRSNGEENYAPFTVEGHDTNEENMLMPNDLNLAYRRMVDATPANINAHLPQSYWQQYIVDSAVEIVDPNRYFTCLLPNDRISITLWEKEDEDGDCYEQDILVDLETSRAYEISEGDAVMYSRGSVNLVIDQSWDGRLNEEASEYYRMERLTDNIENETNDVNEHFSDRQRRRADNDATAMSRQEREGIEQATRKLVSENSRRLPNEQMNAICVHCLGGVRTIKPNISANETQDGWVCRACIINYRACNVCNKVWTSDVTEVTEDGRNVCPDCIGNYVECNGCNKFIKPSNIKELGGEKFCSTCYQYNNLNNQMPRSGEVMRRWSPRKLQMYNSSELGSIVKSPRIFSVEIECQYPNDRILRKVSTTLLPECMGCGSDGSVAGNGVEFQTQKLSGKKGEDFIKMISATLVDHEFDTDKTCGLHIHLDGAHDFRPMTSYDALSHLKMLWAFHWTFEDTILSFLPTNRRSNRFCKLLRTQYPLDKILAATNRKQLERLWYRAESDMSLVSRKNSHGGGETRYSGINIHSLLSNNHIEIRYHSGTINARKMLEWINLHCLILDKCAANKINSGMLNQAMETIDSKEKLEMLFEIVGLQESSREYFRSRVAKFAKRGEEEAALTI